MQVKETEHIGAVKIKDGLFMGDVYASQDLELLITNKITHIVNCSGRELPNHWESLGVAYLTLAWQETDYQVLFEGRLDVVGQISKFIEMALSRGESVLVHSLRGQNRACCAIAAYCMKKYKWTLYKTLEFLQSKKPNMAIRPNFFSQLMNFENKIAQSGQGSQTYNWNEISDNPKNIASDELLVTNTFLNSKPLPQADFTNLTEREYRPNKLTWVDQAASSDPKPNLAILLSPKKKEQNEDGLANLDKDEEGKPYIKSILKGSDKVFYLESNKASPSKGSSKENNDVLVNTLGRKIKTKLRPGSAIISTGKSQLLKSSSMPVFEKPLSDAKMLNIQGNMTQLSANREISKSPKGNVSKDETKQKKDKKSRLSQSASSKDFAVMLNNPNFLQSSAIFENNQEDLRAMLQKEDNLLSSSPNGKSASSSTPSYRSGLSKHNEKVIRRPGQTLKGFRLDELKIPVNGKSAAIYSSNLGMIKYLNKLAGAKTLNELDVSKNPGNFLPKNKKEFQRPLTAPNNTSKREMQDSPYYYAGNYFPSAKQTKEHTKLGSLSANRETSKAFTIKSKVKGTIAGEDDHYDIMDFLNPISVSSKRRFQS